MAMHDERTDLTELQRLLAAEAELSAPESREARETLLDELEAATVWRNDVPASLLAEIALRRARFEQERRAWPAARRAADRAAQLAAQSNDEHQAAQAALVRGTAAFFAGELSQALQHGAEALALGELLENAAVQADARLLLGQTRVKQGDLKAAMTQYERVLPLADGINNHVLLSRTLRGLANIAYQLSKPGSALLYLERALRFATNPIERLADHYAMLTILAETGDFVGVAPQLPALMAEAESLKLPGLQSMAANLMGRIAFLRGDYEGAVHHVREALSIVPASGNPALAGYFLINLSAIRTAQGDLPHAQEVLTEALDILTTHQHQNAVSEVYAALASNALRQGAHADAQRYASRALELALELSNDNNTEYSVYWVNYLVFQAIGKERPATACLTRAYRCLFDQANDLPNEEARDLFWHHPEYAPVRNAYLEANFP